MDIFLLKISEIIDMIAVSILVIGSAMILSRSIPSTIAAYRHNSSDEFYDMFRYLRLHLGQTLVLSLEILIVSDIILSILHRTIEDISILGLTVLIRIALSYFLNIELDHIEKKE